MRALAHWAVKQIDTSLTDEEAERIVRVGGPGDGKVDACWLDEKRKTLWIVQVKGSETLIDQDIQRLDEEEEIEVASFDAEVVSDLRRALEKLQAPPEFYSERFGESLRKYSDARRRNFDIRLAGVVFGNRTPALDEAKRDFDRYLNSDRAAFSKHVLSVYDLTALNELLDRNFEQPIGKVALNTDGWHVSEARGDGVWIALVPATSLVQVRKDYDTRIYHSNFRFMLGLTPVKRGMLATLHDENERHLFHLYNNGITVLGQNISLEGAQLRITNPQVVNGLQTVETLWEVAEEAPGGDVLQGVRVLVRFIDVTRPEFDIPVGRPLEERIAEYSNKQNPILNRDLRSNDAIQKRLQHEIDNLGFKYQRKRGQHPRGTRKVVDNERAAQYMLSFWLKLPAEAKAQKKLLFARSSENPPGYYEKLFPSNVAAEAVLIPYLVYDSMPKGGGGRTAEVLNHGDFVLLTMMGEVIRQRYGFTMRNLQTPRLSALAEALVSELRDGRLDRELHTVWRSLTTSLRKYVDKEMKRRTRIARKEGKPDPTVRNILVGLKYSKVHEGLLSSSRTKSLSRRLPDSRRIAR